MTLTGQTMEWLNQNRYRAYPLQREPWRKSASADSGLDCILLDALVFDADAVGTPALTFRHVLVNENSTEITLSYDGRQFAISLSGGAISGSSSFALIKGAVSGGGKRNATISLMFSSHAYILSVIGRGEWDVQCDVLPSRVVSINKGYGVDSIVSNGSQGVPGHEVADSESASGTVLVADGDVVLEDGYRTSPVIHRGRVLVRVGRRYGEDPCQYDYGDKYLQDCRRPMFFFCGQNAINNGNIVLRGGKGVGVSQGRSYTVRTGTCAGKTIPCIEISAGRELLDIYKPA